MSDSSSSITSKTMISRRFVRGDNVGEGEGEGDDADSISLSDSSSSNVLCCVKTSMPRDVRCGESATLKRFESDSSRAEGDADNAAVCLLRLAPISRRHETQSLMVVGGELSFDGLACCLRARVCARGILGDVVVPLELDDDDRASPETTDGVS